MEMTEQTLETGIEIFARLINQEAVKYQGEHTKLYEAYTQNGDIFDTVNKITKALNLEIYDYRGGLYLTPGESNHVFGYTNEELKEMIGLRLNRIVPLLLHYLSHHHKILYRFSDLYLSGVCQGSGNCGSSRCFFSRVSRESGDACTDRGGGIQF